MELAKTIKYVRELVKAARSDGKKIGFVPTMGALHIGHVSLIDRAVNECDFVVVSIYVNPTQFGLSEDFEKYPRTLDADLKICEKAGTDVVFAPADNEMYEYENITWDDTEKLTEPLCGQSRPGHFKGVTTICAKLFNIVTPDIAYFGQKDAQQSVVIKKMVDDLDMPLQITTCPTLREPDGLALSSRNKYLDSQQRKDAALIYESLQIAAEAIAHGTKEPQTIIDQMRTTLSRIKNADIEYVSVVNADNLRYLDKIAGKALIALAVKIGDTRLIDNILVDAGE
ncbi:MAG: pantoate--beta-alanine ligase [Planctomycetes bacterium]|nr:pantoate--beta-alanine ligase [Planctomycetota bacterium]